MACGSIVNFLKDGGLQTAAVLYLQEYGQEGKRMIFVHEYDYKYEAGMLHSVLLDFPEILRGDFGKMANMEKLYQRMSAWLLLERAVQKEYGLENLKALDIRRTGKGKPWSAAYPKLQFNISHCDAACACAVSAESVGIDVEKRFPYRETLAKKVCHAEEWNCLMRAGEADAEGGTDHGDTNRAEFLRLLWSAKESIVKLEGSGLGYGMGRLNLMPLLRKCAADALDIFQASDIRCEGWLDGIGELRLHIRRTEHYTLAICGSHVEDEIVNVDQLIKS